MRNYWSSFSKVEQTTIKPTTEEIKVVDWKLNAMNFIADFEWFRENAYYDSKQWSIGYGTKSYKWEVIWEQEAKQRKLDHLQPLIEMVSNTCYNDNQRIALVSVLYENYQLHMTIGNDKYIYL